MGVRGGNRAAAAGRAGSLVFGQVAEADRRQGSAPSGAAHDANDARCGTCQCEAARAAACRDGTRALRHRRRPRHPGMAHLRRLPAQWAGHDRGGDVLAAGRAGFSTAAPVTWRQVESGVRPDAYSMLRPFTTSQKRTGPRLRGLKRRGYAT
jgi:hypothetical protein